MVDAEHPPGRVTRRVEVDDRWDARAELGQRVRRDHLRSGQPRADLVGGVGQFRNHHRIVGAQAQKGRQPGDEFLCADHRQHGVLGQTGDAVAAGECGHRRRPQLRRAGRPGISGDRGRLCQRRPDDGRHRIDRRAHREVHDAVRMSTRDGGDLRQGVPGEHRQRLGDPQQPAGAGCGRRGRGVRRQSSSPLGGRSLTTCGSFSVSPTLEAPPGEPSSAKKSALIAVYCADCSGTSSS